MKSLWWRLGLVAVVVGLWVYSVFPIQDRDFLKEFQGLAAPKLAQLRQQDTPAAKQALAEYDTLLAKCHELVTQGAAQENGTLKPLAPSVALKEAAKVAVPGHYVKLREYVEVPGVRGASNDAVVTFARNQSRGKFRLGLDLRGGTEFVISFDPDKMAPGRGVEETRDQILEVLRNRVDGLGMVEPEIKPVGPNSISLLMPSVGEAEKDEIRTTLQQTARLSFHLVHPDSERELAQFQASPQGYLPPAGFDFRDIIDEKDGVQTVQRLLIKNREEKVKGENLADAGVSMSQFGNPAVNIRFDAEGARAFGKVTQENVGNRLAIILDGKVYSAPVLREPIWGGSAEISGSFSLEEAQRLAVVLKSGRLTVPIVIDSELSTEPTLGVESRDAGILATLAGTLAVILFMAIYYRLCGVVAVLALLANMVLLVGTMAILGATFTMPGLAGIALTVGMAVDANVLINERIREELALGRGLENAVQAGFDRAFLTIFDSNITTLFTGFVLLALGSGSVKGFAVTLIIGLVANIFTAVFFCRALFELMIRKFHLKSLGMFQMFQKPNLDIFRYRHVTFAISGAFVLLSLATMAIRGKDCLSTDFAGGTVITYEYQMAAGATAKPSEQEVTKVVEGLGQKVVRAGSKFSGVTRAHIFELVLPAADSGDAAQKLSEPQITSALQQAFPAYRFAFKQSNRVGALVGGQFQKNAVIAVLLSWLLIILYVTFRFEFAYGVASVIALIHDVIIATGLYLLMGREFSLISLAAVLTIIGFSINDTIVIFDRIREGFTLKSGISYAEVVRQSINETLSRTVLTTGTTVISTGALLAMCGGAINDFALLMMFGFMSGTYSTVFIASAIIVSWHKRRPGHLITEEKPVEPDALEGV